MKNILTFDVEEHFQVEAFYDIIPRSAWDQRQSRLTMNMIKIFDILDTHHAKATFFVLGWIADRYPQLISMIVDRGHELASHGYGHDNLKRLSKAEFVADLQKSIESLGRASGIRVRGYRAPTFSADRKKEWIWETMIESGIEYDSSIFPIHHDLYGDPGAPRFPYYIKSSNGKVFEIPPTTYRLLGKHLPACGGGSFRIFPYWYTRRSILAYNKAGYPAMVYIHPWEIDANQPVEKAASPKSRLRHYTNLHTVERKLSRLLSDFQFGSVKEVYAQHLSPNSTFHKQQNK